MAKSPVLGKLKRFDKAFVNFQRVFIKTVDENHAAKEVTDIKDLAKVSEAGLQLNVKLIAMPKAFRLRLRDIGFGILLKPMEDYSQENTVLQAIKNNKIIDKINLTSLINMAVYEIKLLEATIGDGELESYLNQFE